MINRDIRESSIQWGLYLLFSLIITLHTGIVKGQYSSNSLYSLFGIGDLQTTSFAKQSGLGRAGVALKSDGFINTLNPSSFTENGANSVLFDIGLSGYISSYESRGDYVTASDANLDHFAMAFPVTKWWGTSIGFAPFSSISYDISTTSVYEGSTSEIETEFVGSGGISEFFFMNSFKLNKHLSLGVSLSYLMGSLDQTEISKLNSVGFYDVNTINTYYMRNFYVGFGLQYTQKIKNDNITFGLTYRPPQKLVASYSHEITIPVEQIVIVSETNMAQSFEIPADLNVGLAYDINSKFQIVGDYGIQKWSGNSNLLDAVSFTDRYSFHLGFEYKPNPVFLTNFFQKVEYRLGGFYENTYILMRENQIKDYGFTIGFGVPLKNQKSQVNFSLEIGQLGTLNDGLVKEKYLGFSLDFVLYDKWFVKRKFD